MRVSPSLITKSEELLSKTGLVRTASSQPGSGGLRLLMDTTVVQVYNDVSPDGSRKRGGGVWPEAGPGWKEAASRCPTVNQIFWGEVLGKHFLCF